MTAKTVTGVWIYPVKSLGGIRVSSARVMPKGFEYDRRWMLIDGDTKFIMQRACPQMALCKLSISEDNFVIRYDEHVTSLPFHFEEEAITAEIWNDRVEVNEVSRHHSEWFSDMLRITCRLVRFPEKNRRPVDA